MHSIILGLRLTLGRRTRVCSLLSGATEVVYRLGLGDQLVGVSHACDYPGGAVAKLVVSRSLRQITHLDSKQMDAIIQRSCANGNSLYWIDGELLRELGPDLIVTQEFCKVCGIYSGSVFEAAEQVLDYIPQSRPFGPTVWK